MPCFTINHFCSDVVLDGELWVLLGLRSRSQGSSSSQQEARLLYFLTQTKTLWIYDMFRRSSGNVYNWMGARFARSYNSSQTLRNFLWLLFPIKMGLLLQTRAYIAWFLWRNDNAGRRIRRHSRNNQELCFLKTRLGKHITQGKQICAAP